MVTTEGMYRVEVGPDNQLHKVWSVPYETIGVVRPGQYEPGSGTTPTILGEGKDVAITDNAPQTNVVVYRTDEAGCDPIGRKGVRSNLVEAVPPPTRSSASLTPSSYRTTTTTCSTGTPGRW